MNEKTKDKIKGVIFGQAIGDALGLGTEFLTKEQIAQLYPNGYSQYDQMVRDEHRSRWPIGSWTDDTDQFLCILDSILANEQIDELDIARRFKNWLDTNGMGIGNTTYKVLTLPQYVLYPKKGAELIWKMRRRNIAPNGGLMRNGILGTYKYWNTREVLQNSRNVCQLTHYDPRCAVSAEIMSYIIMKELNESPADWSQFIEIAREYDPRILDYMVDISDNIESLKLDEEAALGYVLKALNAGIWSYFNATSFEQGVLDIIHEGGDADTNACIVGSLLGSKFGFSSIPSSWVQGLLNKEMLESKTEKYLEHMSSIRKPEYSNTLSN